MGIFSSNSVDEDKPLLLCRERKRFVKQALEGRFSLAAAHVCYIRSLRSTGTALRKFVEPDALTESSLYTSTSATPEPLALTEKSLSQFSYPSPSPSPSPSQHVDTIETLSPPLSPLHSSQFQANYMKSKFGSSTTIREKPNFPVTATFGSSSSTPQNSQSQLAETPTFEPPPRPPGTPAWDYFDFFNSIDNQVPFEERRRLSHEWDDSDDLRQLREEEGIPDLEEDGEKVSFIGRTKVHRSGHELDELFVDQEIQKSKKQNAKLGSYLLNASGSIAQGIDNEMKEKDMNDGGGDDDDGVGDDDGDQHDGDYNADESPDATQSKTTPSVLVVTTQEKGGWVTPEAAPKDLLSSIRDIEYQFHRASDSGKEVPRMLEANQVHYRPMFTEIKGRKSIVTKYFTACLVCCGDTTPVPPDLTPSTTKYLTWHRTVSSRSSSSKNPVGPIPKDDVDDSSNDFVDNFCMNSGSHASTLDRLYAWERKLYDEVKASGLIRREYDAKCRILRQQELKGESHEKIDKTRAVVKDLHSRIRVGIHRIGSISERIEELRDKELHPQLVELIEGLSRMWGTMLQCHRIQRKIISIAYFTGTSKIPIQSETRRQTTINLESELNFLGTSFTKWIAAHKSYLQSLNSWLLKCVLTMHQKKSSRGRKMPFSPRRDRAPPIFVTCRDWSNGFEALPTKEVGNAIRDLAAKTRRFLPHQEKSNEKKILNFKFSSSSSSWKGDQKGGSRKTLLDAETEAPEDWDSCFKTLQSSLTAIFKSLVDFSGSSSNMYNGLRVAIQEAQIAYDRSVKV